jgi:hypothetical protein
MPTDNGWGQPAENRELAAKFDELKSQKEPPPQRELSFGQKLVGLTFNPSGDPKVNKAKELCAELADLLYDDHKGKDATDLYDELYHHAIGEILNAQMNAVKVLTLKY